MSNQTIHELTNLSEISTNDELPIWDNSAGTTKKVNVEELSLAVNNSINSYSTEEVNTGAKWIDGKEIYKRTFVYNAVSLTSGTETQITTNFPINSTNIVKTEVYGYNTAGIFISDIRIRSTTNNALNALQSVSTGTYNIYFTVYYTKTTA